jgi:hypothetical protein
MKKLIIGAIVGGILLFMWQFLSNVVFDLHRPMLNYTPKQTEVLKYLSDNLEPGFYSLPSVPEGTSMDESEKYFAQWEGKPWGQIQIHKSLANAMGGKLARSLITDILAVLLLCWVLLKNSNINFMNILLSCLAVGLMSYLTTYYSNSIWYETISMPDLIDTIVGWGVVGAWLGWWMSRK